MQGWRLLVPEGATADDLKASTKKSRKRLWRSSAIRNTAFARFVRLSGSRGTPITNILVLRNSLAKQMLAALFRGVLVRHEAHTTIARTAQ
jgi:hypothetical protein